MHTKVIVVGDDPEEALEPFYEYDYPPDPRWDYHSLGVRFENQLLLKSGEAVNQARKREIDFGAMDGKNFREWSAGAVVMCGVWHQYDHQPNPEWSKKFAELMDAVGDDEMMSVYDCHS